MLKPKAKVRVRKGWLRSPVERVVNSAKQYDRERVREETLQIIDEALEELKEPHVQA